MILSDIHGGYHGCNLVTLGGDMSNSGGSTLKTFSDVFAGNVAVQYAAFNLRDNYYREMAKFLFYSAIP